MHINKILAVSGFSKNIAFNVAVHTTVNDTTIQAN